MKKVNAVIVSCFRCADIDMSATAPASDHSFKYKH